jgi:hypothetical protein
VGIIDDASVIVFMVIASIAWMMIKKEKESDLLVTVLILA